jgi:predicted secreted protein
VFQATYAFSGAKLPFFIMVATPAEAAAAWQSYLEFSGKFGGKAAALPDVNGAKVFQAESFGAFKVIYQKEGEVGGVFDAADQDKARQFVEQYLQGRIQ